MDSKKEIQVVHAIHPLTQQLFHSTAAPQELINANKSASQVLCTTCFTTRPKLQMCQRCKSVWYCSKECQKKDWPRHKTRCTPSERPNGIRPLVKNLVCNITLVSMLQVCAAFDLDLVNDKKKEIGFKFPFMIRVDIAVEPSDIISFIKLFLTDDSIPEKLEGMVQINRFHSHIPGQSGHAPLTKMRDTVWRSEREKANDNPALRHNPVGLLEFVNDSDFSITIPFAVFPGPVKLAKEKDPFVMLSALEPGTSFEKPMTVASCMEFINTHIRSDKQNQLRLRAEMTMTDKMTVRSIRDKSVTKEAVVLLRQKMERELIYANLLLD